MFWRGDKMLAEIMKTIIYSLAVIFIKYTHPMGFEPTIFHFAVAHHIIEPES